MSNKKTHIDRLILLYFLERKKLDISSDKIRDFVNHLIIKLRENLNKQDRTTSKYRITITDIKKELKPKVASFLTKKSVTEKDYLKASRNVFDDFSNKKTQKPKEVLDIVSLYFGYAGWYGFVNNISIEKFFKITPKDKRNYFEDDLMIGSDYIIPDKSTEINPSKETLEILQRIEDGEYDSILNELKHKTKVNEKSKKINNDISIIKKSITFLQKRFIPKSEAEKLNEEIDRFIKQLNINTQNNHNELSKGQVKLLEEQSNIKTRIDQIPSLLKKYSLYPIIGLTIIVFFLGVNLISPRLNKHSNKNTLTTEIKEHPIQAFATPPPKDSLRVLITRFGNDDTYGKTIKNRIDEVVDRDSLPIKAIYSHNTPSPNSVKGETKPIIEKHNVDILIYGKLSELNSSTGTNKGYLKYEVSDELHNLLSAFEREKLQTGNSTKTENIIESIEEQKTMLFSESFDDWLKGIASYKIGIQNRELFYINPNLPPKERAKKLYDRATLIKGYYTEESYEDLIEAAELDSTNIVVNKKLCNPRFRNRKSDRKYCDRLVKLEPNAENYLSRGMKIAFTSSIYEKGITRREKNYKEKVMSNFHKAIELEPNNPKVYLSAIKFFEIGGLKIGFDAFMNPPSLAENYIIKGLKIAQKNYKANDKESHKLLAELYNARAFCYRSNYINKIDTIRSIENLLVAIKYNPESNTYKRNLISLYKKQKKYDEVLKLYHQMTENTPLDVTVYKDKAEFFKSIKQKDSVINTYKILSKINSNEGHFLLAKEFLERKDSLSIINALENINLTIENDSSKTKFYETRIKIYKRLKRINYSQNDVFNSLIYKDYLKKFRLSNYSYIDAHSDFFIFSEDYKQSLSICDSFIIRRPFYSNPYSVKAKIYEKQRLYKRAIDIYKDAIHQSIGKKYFHERIIDIYLIQKDTVKIKEEYGNLINSNPRINYKLFKMALLLNDTNNIISFGEAMNYGPYSESITCKIFNFYLSNKNLQGAKEYFKKILSNNIPVHNLYNIKPKNILPVFTTPIEDLTLEYKRLNYLVDYLHIKRLKTKRLESLLFATKKFPDSSSFCKKIVDISYSSDSVYQNYLRGFKYAKKLTHLVKNNTKEKDKVIPAFINNIIKYKDTLYGEKWLDSLISVEPKYTHKKLQFLQSTYRGKKTSQKKLLIDQCINNELSLTTYTDETKSRYLIDKALIFIDSNNKEKAIQILESLSLTNHKSLLEERRKIYKWYGYPQKSLNDCDSLISIYKTIDHSHHKLPYLYQEKGKLFSRLNRFDDAYKVYIKAEKIQPNFSISKDIITCLFNLNKSEEALEKLFALSKSNSNFKINSILNSFNPFIKKLKKNHNWNQLISLASKVIKIQPSLENYKNRGMFYLSAQKFTEAFDDFDKANTIAKKKAIDIRFDFENFMYNHTQKIENNKNWKELIKVYTKIIEIEPSFDNYLQRAKYYINSHNTRLAEKDYYTALNLKEKPKKYYLGSFYNILITQRHYKLAEKYLEEAKELPVDKETIYLYSSYLQFKKKNYNEALDLTNKILKENDSSYRSHQLQKQIHCKLKQYDKSLASINKCIEMYKGESASYENQKGLILDKLGRHKEAKEQYIKAIEINKSNYYGYYVNLMRSNVWYLYWYIYFPTTFLIIYLIRLVFLLCRKYGRRKKLKMF